MGVKNGGNEQQNYNHILIPFLIALLNNSRDKVCNKPKGERRKEKEKDGESGSGSRGATKGYRAPCAGG